MRKFLKILPIFLICLGSVNAHCETGVLQKKRVVANAVDLEDGTNGGQANARSGDFVCKTAFNTGAMWELAGLINKHCDKSKPYSVSNVIGDVYAANGGSVGAGSRPYFCCIKK